jgi:hypothetical protein
MMQGSFMQQRNSIISAKTQPKKELVTEEEREKFQKEIDAAKGAV